MVRASLTYIGDISTAARERENTSFPARDIDCSFIYLSLSFSLACDLLLLFLSSLSLLSWRIFTGRDPSFFNVSISLRNPSMSSDPIIPQINHQVVEDDDDDDDDTRTTTPVQSNKPRRVVITWIMRPRRATDCQHVRNHRRLAHRPAHRIGRWIRSFMLLPSRAISVFCKNSSPKPVSPSIAVIKRIQPLCYSVVPVDIILVPNICSATVLIPTPDVSPVLHPSTLRHRIITPASPNSFSPSTKPSLISRHSMVRLRCTWPVSTASRILFNCCSTLKRTSMPRWMMARQRWC